MTHASASGELADAFVTLNGRLQVEGSQDGALQRLVELAVSMIPGCEWAAITAWPASKAPYSLASSDEVATAADQLQYVLGDGPCLTAADDSEMVRILDIAEEDRWPNFAAAALSGTPVRGVLSFHLAEQPHRSALNLYTGKAGTFDDDAVSLAALFAAHARVLLLHAASSDKAANLQIALTTSRQIGTAVGILMNIHKITAEDAFDLLRVSSQHLNRKLNDVADEVTHTGALPDPRTRRR